MKINRIVNLVLLFLLVMMSASCQNEVKIIWPEEMDINKVSISVTTEYAHSWEETVYPGERVTLDSRSDSTKHVVDDTKTVVWTFTETSDRHGSYKIPHH